MKYLIYLFLLFTFNCHSQNSTDKKVGSPCEGCEAIYEYGDNQLTQTATLPAYIENEPKLKVTGTVYQKNGKSPAEGVILYIYHTNREGIYEKRGDEKGWARRHGYIRGWVKTGKDGKYTFHTFRPASYPSRTEPEHIHMVIKEPGKTEYYIDDIVFDDDPLLTVAERKAFNNRGGTGLVQPKLENNTLTVTRDIYLGVNILNYD